MSEESFMNYDHAAGEPAELAALYAAGALAPKAGAALEAHLAGGCAACRAELEKFAPVVAALAAAIQPVEVPPWVYEALRRRVDAEDGPAPAD
jgi:hypothetical protein